MRHRGKIIEVFGFEDSTLSLDLVFIGWENWVEVLDRIDSERSVRMDSIGTSLDIGYDWESSSFWWSFELETDSEN